jgi:hypothetical protein
MIRFFVAALLYSALLAFLLCAFTQQEVMLVSVAPLALSITAGIVGCVLTSRTLRRAKAGYELMVVTRLIVWTVLGWGLAAGMLTALWPIFELPLPYGFWSAAALTVFPLLPVLDVKLDEILTK